MDGSHLHGRDMNKTYTIWNEIDERIYEGTPDFKTREEAREWWEKNDGRPSSIIVERVTFDKDE